MVQRSRYRNNPRMSGFFSSLRNLASGSGTGRHQGQDTRMRFSVTPYPGDSGFAQWHDAMKMVARLPGGIPPEFRKRLWLTLAEKHLQARNVDWSQVERFCFNEWSNPDDDELGVQIVKDLHRTGCSLFCGAEAEENQALLKRVLLAYARWNKAVGYCQGFNMLAALILQVMDRSESDSVKVMIYLIEGVLPESYFANNLRGLSVDMAVFRDLLRLRLPSLSRHLEQLQHEAGDSVTGTSYEPPLTNVFTMQWFLTLFSNCLPQVTVLRVWDLIFLEGNEVLLRTALAIWDVLADRIMAVTSADEFYSIMGVLTREMLEFGLMDTNKLVKTIVTIAPFPFPELPDLRDKYLYNITPWTQQVSTAARKGLRLFYSDDDEETDEDDEKIAVAAAYGITSVFRSPRRKDSLTRAPSPTTSLSTVGYSMYPSDKERITLDISALKHQYAKLRERQRQAHIILTAACARQPLGPSAPTPVAMNHLLLGKSALLSVRGKRGPPQGAIPPPANMALRAAPKAHRGKAASLPVKGQTIPANKTVKPEKQKEEKESGETLHWKDTASTRKLRRGSRDVQIDDDTAFTDPEKSIPLITTSDLSDVSSKVAILCRSEDGYSVGIETEESKDEENDNTSDSSSTSTELCDEPDRLSDFDSEEPTSISDASSYLPPSHNVLKIPSATTESSATTPDLLSPSSAMRDYSPKSSSADNSEIFASSETTTSSSATTPSPMVENKGHDDWSSKDDAEDLSISAIDNAIPSVAELPASNDSSTLHVSSDEKSFSFSDQTLTLQQTPVSADTSFALNVSDTGFVSPEQSKYEKQISPELIQNSPELLQSIKELSQCLEEKSNIDQINVKLVINESPISDHKDSALLTEENTVNKTLNLVINQSESITGVSKTPYVDKYLMEERLDNFSVMPNIKDATYNEDPAIEVKDTKQRHYDFKDSGATVYENNVNVSRDFVFVSEKSESDLHNYKPSVDKESSTAILTQSQLETEVNKTRQNDAFSPVHSVPEKESEIYLGLMVDYSEMAEILETEQSIDLGRRNSERALKIIQENSEILQRILQCHARKMGKASGEDVDTGKVVALENESEFHSLVSPNEDKFGVINDDSSVSYSAVNKDVERIEFGRVCKETESPLAPGLTKIKQKFSDNELQENQYSTDMEQNANLEKFVSNDGPIISTDSRISQSLSKSISSLPIENSNSLYSKQQEESKNTLPYTRKNEENLGNMSIMQSNGTENKSKSNEILKPDAFTDINSSYLKFDLLREPPLCKSDTSILENEILHKSTMPDEHSSSTNIDILHSSAVSEPEYFSIGSKATITKHECSIEPNTSSETTAYERSYFTSEPDSLYRTSVLDSDFSSIKFEKSSRRDVSESEFSAEHRFSHRTVSEPDSSSVKIETNPNSEVSEDDNVSTELKILHRNIRKPDRSSTSLATFHKTETLEQDLYCTEQSVSQSTKPDYSSSKVVSFRRTEALEHDVFSTENSPFRRNVLEPDSWSRKPDTSVDIAVTKRDSLFTEYEVSDMKTVHEHISSAEHRLEHDFSSTKIDTSCSSAPAENDFGSTKLSTNIDVTRRAVVPERNYSFTEFNTIRKKDVLEGDSLQNISSTNESAVKELDTSAAEHTFSRDSKRDFFFLTKPDTSHKTVPDYDSFSLESYAINTKKKAERDSFSLEPKLLSRITMDESASFPTNTYSSRRKTEEKLKDSITPYQDSETSARISLRLSTYDPQEKKSSEYTSRQYSQLSEIENTSERKYPSYLSAKRYDERRSTIHTCDKVDRDALKSINKEFSKLNDYSKANNSNMLEPYSIKGSSVDLRTTRLECNTFKHKSYSDITSPLSTEDITFNKSAIRSDVTYNKSSYSSKVSKEDNSEEDSHRSRTPETEYYRRKGTDSPDISYSSPSRKTSTLSVDNAYSSNKRWSTGTYYSDFRPTDSPDLLQKKFEDFSDTLPKPDSTELPKYSSKHTRESWSSTSESVYKIPSRSRSKSPSSSPSRTHYTSPQTYTSTSTEINTASLSESRGSDLYRLKYSSGTYRNDSEKDAVISKSQVGKSPMTSPTKEKDFRASFPPIKSSTSASSSHAISKYDPFPSRSSQRQPKELGVKLGLYCSTTTSKSKYSSKKYDDK